MLRYSHLNQNKENWRVNLNAFFLQSTIWDVHSLNGWLLQYLSIFTVLAIIR